MPGEDAAKQDEPIILSARGVAAVLGISVSTIYRLMHTDPTFPRPRALGMRVARWARGDIDAWVATLPERSLPSASHPATPSL